MLLLQGDQSFAGIAFLRISRTPEFCWHLQLVAEGTTASSDISSRNPWYWKSSEFWNPIIQSRVLPPRSRMTGKFSPAHMASRTEHSGLGIPRIPSKSTDRFGPRVSAQAD